jgi:hypothetical protein
MPLLSCYLATVVGYTDAHRCDVFNAAQIFLSSHYLAMKEGIHFIESLHNSDRKDAHRDTQTDGRDL